MARRSDEEEEAGRTEDAEAISDMETELWEKTRQNSRRVEREVTERNIESKPRSRPGTAQRSRSREVTERPNPIHGGVLSQRTPGAKPSNETEISCGEPEKTFHRASSVDGRPPERKSQACSPSASSIG